MEKKTIGAFIAALRKANGITQQELADKLNISNKAVSRWEREECSPDITLIPALAEILGVTCDELLKGERILSDYQQEKNEPKVEKQIKMLVNRSISKFIILIWISIALSVAPLACIQVLTYGVSNAIIADVGFFVSCLSVVVAFIIAAIATAELSGVKCENELFENANTALINRYNKALGYFSLVAFIAVTAVVVISFFQIFFFTIKGIYGIKSHLICFFIGVFFAVILWIIVRDKYYFWITKQPHKKADLKLLLMNSLQLGAVALASIFFGISPSFDEPQGSTTAFALICLAYSLLAVSAIVFIIFISACKADRKKLILSGLRNLLLIIPSVLIQLIRRSGFLYTNIGNGIIKWNRVDVWFIDFVLIDLALILFILAVFDLIKKFIKRFSKS